MSQATDALDTLRAYLDASPAHDAAKITLLRAMSALPMGKGWAIGLMWGHDEADEKPLLRYVVTYRLDELAGTFPVKAWWIVAISPKGEPKDITVLHDNDCAGFRGAAWDCNCVADYVTNWSRADA